MDNLNDKPKTLRGAAYGRVSTSNQVIEHGSLEQQRNLSIEWAAHLTKSTGYEHKIIHFLEDEAISGVAEYHRPAYEKLLQLIREEKIDFCILKELSRASRDMEQLTSLISMAQRHKVKLLVRNLENIDFSTPSGQVMAYMIGALGSYERALCRQRQNENLRSRCLNNKLIPGGPVVLGFDRHKEKKGVWVPNQEELQSVIFIMQTFLETGSFKQTALETCRVGIKNKTGTPFTHKSIRIVLTSKKYIGKMKVPMRPGEKETWVDLPYGPVVPVELFERVQERIATLSESNSNQNKVSLRVYLLSGILHHEDGSSFTGQSCTNGSGGRKNYYWNGKNKIRMKAEELEEAIFNRLIESVKDSSELLKSLNTLKSHRDSKINALQEQQRTLRAKLAETEENDEKLLCALREGLSASAATLSWVEDQVQRSKTQKEKVVATLREVEDDLAKFKALKIDSGIQGKAIADNLRKIHLGDPIKARNFLRQVFESIIVSSKSQISRFFPLHCIRH